jgi:isoleucyl-tRNA synthetase
VLDQLFGCLTAWLAPFTCFTAEEAWLARHPGDRNSVHLRLFPDIPEDWRDDALADKWAKLRQLRRAVTGALEIERASRRIGSSLQAHPLVYADADYRQAAGDADLPDLFITSAADFADGEPPADAFSLPDVPGVRVKVEAARGEKCERCWKVLEEVGGNPEHPGICGRCADSVERFSAAAE